MISQGIVGLRRGLEVKVDEIGLGEICFKVSHHDGPAPVIRIPVGVDGKVQEVVHPVRVECMGLHRLGINVHGHWDLGR